LRLNDGREIRGDALAGSTLQVGARVLRLNAVRRDETNTASYLYDIKVVGAGGSTEPLCDPDSRGERWAIPVADRGERISFVCSSGAIGKCVRWGYAPSTEPARQELHDACVRMARADYGGDGTSATRDGTVIAFCDRAGIHPCVAVPSGIEAAWSSEGATCVARTRVEGLLTLEQLGARYPRMAGHLGSICTLEDGDPRTILFSWLPPD
jgi:hypothetical protein